MLLEYIAHQAPNLEQLVKVSGFLAGIKEPLSNVIQNFSNHNVIYDGVGGSGKSVLAYYIDRLWQNKNPLFMKATDASVTMDKYKSPWGTSFVTMPGQDLQPRRASWNKVQRGSWYQQRAKIDGVVFAVSWGYPRPPRTGENVSFEQARKSMLEKELEILNDVAQRITTMDSPPRFFLTTLTKVDLYQDQLTDAITYYNSGRFLELKNQIQGSLGINTITLEESYVATRLDDLIWKDKLVKGSQLNETQRDSLITAHCAHVLRLSKMATQ